MAKTGARLLGRVSGLALGLVLGQILTGITYIVAARLMSPGELGAVATIVALCSIASSLFDGGLSTLCVREVAAGTMSMDKFLRLGSTKRLLCPVLVALLSGMAIIVLGGLYPIAVLGLLGWVIWEAQLSNSALRASGRFGSATFAQVGGRLSGLCLMLVVATVPVVNPDLGLAMALLVGFLAEAVFGQFALRRLRSLVSLSKFSDLMAHQRTAVPLGAISITGLGQQLDAPLVSLGAGFQAAGIYAGASRLLGPLLFLSSALGMGALPYVSTASGQDRSGAELRVRRLALVLSFAPLVAAPVGYFIIPVLLGAGYSSSGGVFAVLAVGAAVSTLSQGRVIVLQARRMEKSAARCIALGLGVSLALTVALAYVGGAVAAAFAFVIGQLAILLMLCRVGRQMSRV